MPQQRSSAPDPTSLGRRRFLHLAGLSALAAGGTMAVGSTTLALADPGTDTQTSGSSAGLVSGCSSEVAVRWFDLLTELVKRTPGYSPPVAARSFGYAGVTLYQSLVGGMPGNRSLAGQLDGLPRTPGSGLGRGTWPLVANAALAEVARRWFPAAPADLAAGVEALEAELAATSGVGVHPLWRAVARLRGRAVAGTVYDWSVTDGGHEAYLGSPTYVPPPGPGLWRPTPPAFLPGLQARWGSNRTMVPSLVDGATAPPPPTYSADPASPFSAAAREVYDTVNGRTSEQEAIARFWADGAGETATPSGHWVSLLTELLRERGASLDEAAEAYARVGVAVNDAFICCWATKYATLLLRPVTYVRDHIDPAWLPLLVTPPFPEYTSGHSVQSAASARVLTELFGVVAFTDEIHVDRGLPPRSFPSFDAAAEEAAVSRLYGGIHYRFGVEEGVVQGRLVGDAVNALRWRV